MHLFPESGFDQSAITPVFLGVLISWFFTETFGWVFVGLVVPGYLATLFLLDPRSAAIDVIEAALSYVVARLLCEQLSWTGLTSRMFGRERFLMILVVSVLVRLGVEGLLIPWALPHAKWAYSIGLVVVPLAANACWKTGLVRGAVQNGVPTLIVYVLLRWLFVPHTNLSLAGFHLSIEDVASSFLRSPRAYVLLLTGAVLAAVANVRYGWDYGGILIPALIALVVATPTKLAATFGEALLLVGIVSLLVKFTAVGRWNIEGPRRPVLFLSADYALRFAVAAVAGRHLPGTEIVELTGLGYLLPSLLAVKVSQRTVAAVFLPTLTVSALAFAASSASAAIVAGFGEDALARDPPLTRRLGAAPDAPVLAALWLSALSRTAPERARVGNSESARARARAIGAWASGDRRALETLEVQQLSSGFALARERFADLDHRHGFPAVLISKRRSLVPRTVGLVPAPLAAPQAAALAGHWLELGALDALVVAGVEETRTRDAEENEALTVARELADAAGQRGLVVAIRDGGARCTVRVGSRPRSAVAARAFLQRRSADLQGCEDPRGAPRSNEDLAFEVAASAADPWLGPVPAGPSLATSSALSLALSEAHLASTRSSLEELLVLRRLVLEPLLVHDGDSTPSLALSAAAAGSLGYRLFAPSQLASGEQGVLLLPGAQGAALALVARVGGVRGLVVEVPHAGNRALRALALRLAKPVQAEAVILGLEPEEGALGNQAFAEAHAAALWPRSDRASSVVTLRMGAAAELPDPEPSLGLSQWGGVLARPLVDRVERALTALELTSHPEELDLVSREQAGRSLFGQTPLVAVSVPLSWLRAADRAQRPQLLREFERFPTFDSEVPAAVQTLALSLPEPATDAPESVLDTAGVAALERSVVALRLLEDQTASAACRASVVRADSGVYLVLVARRERRLRVAAFPLLFGAATRPERFARKTLAECASKISRGGSCTVEARP